jgi:hypothetical protein
MANVSSSANCNRIKVSKARSHANAFYQYCGGAGFADVRKRDWEFLSAMVCFRKGGHVQQALLKFRLKVRLGLRRQEGYCQVDDNVVDCLNSRAIMAN